VIPGTKWTVDNICSLGLIRYDTKSRVLTCAFIWLWLLGNNPNEPLMSKFITGDYFAIQDKLQGSEYFLPTWNQWELFNAYFRSVKSTVFKGQQVNFQELYHGALLNCETFQVTVTELDFAKASRQYSTKSGEADQIQTERGTFCVSSCSHFFINCSNAKAGDGWCGLQCNPPRREIHQYKLVKDNISKVQFKNERKKAAGDEDIFLLFSIYQNKFEMSDLPKNSGIVYLDNFQSYYGPFAGRAFLITGTSSLFFRPNANTAPRAQLEAVSGIGTKRAEIILEERKKKQFVNLEDCIARTKISQKYLEGLQW